MTHQGTKRLETDRLILRRFTPDDAQAMYENWASDPDVTRYLTWQPYENRETADYVIGLWVNDYQNEKNYQWAIESKELSAPIGSIAAVEMNEDVESVEIGYCIGKRWWHKGFMTEALSAVICFFFEEVGASRVCACHDPQNPRSGSVMKKCGMQYEGTLRSVGRNNQGVCDASYYSILKSDYFRTAEEKPFVQVRPARRDELEAVNVIRKQVNDIHVNGRPDIFRKGFCEEMKEHIFEAFDAENAGVLVALLDGTVCGFAAVQYLVKPLSPYNLERNIYRVEEFGVDERFRRRGVGAALVGFLKTDAKKKGYGKIELDMWAFNDSAYAFYRAMGFETFRRYMELNL